MSEPESEAPGALCLMSNREDLQGIDNQPYVPTAALQKLVATKRNSAAFGGGSWSGGCFVAQERRRVVAPAHD